MAKTGWPISSEAEGNLSKYYIIIWPLLSTGNIHPGPQLELEFWSLSGVVIKRIFTYENAISK